MNMLDFEARRSLGKGYDECSAAERDAVRFSVNSKRIQNDMTSAGAKTLGELVQMRRDGRA